MEKQQVTGADGKMDIISPISGPTKKMEVWNWRKNLMPAARSGKCYGCWAHFYLEIHGRGHPSEAGFWTSQRLLDTARGRLPSLSVLGHACPALQHCQMWSAKSKSWGYCLPIIWSPSGCKTAWLYIRSQSIPVLSMFIGSISARLAPTFARSLKMPLAKSSLEKFIGKHLQKNKTKYPSHDVHKLEVRPPHLWRLVFGPLKFRQTSVWPWPCS